jgi:protein gp37
MRMAARLDAMGSPKYRGLTRRSGGRYVWTGRVNLDVGSLSIPHGWRKPRKVFVNSMSDLFHAEVPAEFIAEVWQTMLATPRHTYQVLTKRPERMRELLTDGTLQPASNIWVGTSVESGEVLSRLDELRVTPAFVRFVSFEPLIGSVSDADLSGIHWAIVGGESGPRARPMDPEWVEEIEELCRRDGAAFFFKQWGGRNKKATGRELHGRTYDEMPAHIS